MEDRSIKKTKARPAGTVAWPVAGLLIAVMTAMPVKAQTATSAPAFSAKVVDLSSVTSNITVPLDRSVTVETTVEMAKANVVARQFADVQLISPKRLLLTGQRYGSTNVVLESVDGRQYVFNVDVELDLTSLNAALRRIDPLGNASASSVKGNILLSGTVSGADRAMRMIEIASLFLPRGADGTAMTGVQNHLEVAGEQQVMIRCTVAEINRSALRQLGVNGFMLGENLKDMFLVNQLGGINPANIGAAADALVTQNVPFLTGENGIPLSTTPTLSLGFPRVQTQVFLKAMADNSLLTILAEPNLVAVSGETASFLAGGEFPIPVPQGNQQVTIEWREFGVRLNFTPVVRGEQMVRLRVAPEVSELDFSTSVQIEGFVVPGLTSRSTETTVELGAGQTMALAGLLSDNTRGLASRVPGVGDVPVLGALFRSVEYQRSLTELVILLTPEIVAPLDSHQKIRLPTDGYESPDEMELYMLGLLDSLASTPQNDDDDDLDADDDDDMDSDVSATMSMQVKQPGHGSLQGPWGLAEVAGKR